MKGKLLKGNLTLCHDKEAYKILLRIWKVDFLLHDRVLVHFKSVLTTFLLFIQHLLILIVLREGPVLHLMIRQTTHIRVVLQVFKYLTLVLTAFQSQGNLSVYTNCTSNGREVTNLTDFVLILLVSED